MKKIKDLNIDLKNSRNSEKIIGSSFKSDHNSFSARKEYVTMSEGDIRNQYGEYLNDNQVRSLRDMTFFGWRLAFVRRPANHKTAVVVVSNAERTRYGVLERDGRVNTSILR